MNNIAKIIQFIEYNIDEIPVTIKPYFTLNKKNIIPIVINIILINQNNKKIRNTIFE